ncbi:MAG: DUF1080 domain-containing protein [Anaerolineae bacterium]|nr:DUF1080 domain-containing protein [Anaerolineae bacterium]
MTRSPLAVFLLTGTLILTVSLACASSGTPTAQPTVAVPTATQPEPTVAVTPTPPTGYFTETFDGTLDNWLSFAAKGRLNQASLNVHDGFYVFDLPQQNVSIYSIYAPASYTDVRIDVEVENRGNNKNGVSIVCRYSDTEGWYEASVGNNGLFKIQSAKWDKRHASASYDLIYSGGSNEIRQGRQANTYTFICQGHTLILGINGALAQQLTDNSLSVREGNIGVGVSSYNVIPVNVGVNSVETREP